MKVTEVMMVASSDMPTAQPGTERLARKYSSVVFWRRERRTPTPTSTAMYPTMRMTSKGRMRTGLPQGGREGGAGGGHFDGHAHGSLHVAAVGAVLAGDVEGGAVIDGGADDGDTEGNVDGLLEVDELH